MKKTFKNSIPILRTLTIVIATIGLFTGCDENFSPLKETDQYFYSIYGYLDATADTQWVRIMPVREKFEPEPIPFNGNVTLTDINNNIGVPMNDSLFQPVENIGLWNFWSDYEIEPGNTYDLTVVRTNDGIRSNVQVTMPPDYPTPILVEEDSQYLLINGVQNLADIHTVWKVRNNITRQEFVFRFPHRKDTVLPEGNDFKVELNQGDDLLQIERRFNGENPTGEPLFTVLQRQIFIASAGPEWVNFDELSEIIITLPEGISNVQNGVGYMVGIISKTIPWEVCYATPDEDEFVACELEEPIDER